MLIALLAIINPAEEDAISLMSAIFAIALRTLCLVSSLISELSCIAREAVEGETPARRATSLIVAIRKTSLSHRNKSGCILDILKVYTHNKRKIKPILISSNKTGSETAEFLRTNGHF